MVDVDRFFDTRLRRYGDDPRSLDWSEKGQRTRFEVMAEVGDLAGASVLDVGCGLGHFYDYLRECGLDVAYSGLDRSSPMIAAARARHPELEFQVKEVGSGELGEADFVFASGVLNVAQGDNELAMKRLLRAAFTASRRAAVVNMLSAWADKQDRGRHYYDPVKTVRFARGLTRKLVLRHDYLPHDFTLYLHRETRQ